jgi:MoxR-like ATPase
MADRFLKHQLSNQLEPVVEGETILRMQSEVEEVKVNQDLVTYITKIVQETRKDSNITLGASPRATLALIRASQARAYLSGRNYCIPDDIIAMVKPVISHRIILSPEAKLAQMKVEKVLKNIVAKIPIPILS